MSAGIYNPANASNETVDAHLAATNNPHNVTKEQLGVSELTNPKAFAGGVSFDSTGNGEIDSLSLGNIEGRKVTLAFNIKLNASFGQDVIFSKGGRANGGYFVGIFNDGKLQFLSKQDGSFSTCVDVKFGPVLSGDKWYDIKLIIDNVSTLKLTLIIDGLVEVEGLEPAVSGTYGDDNINKAYLCSRDNGSLNYYGSIKDFAFFNRALSATEAADLYNQGVQGWLAANPENKWATGPESFDNPSGNSDFSSTPTDWSAVGATASATINSGQLDIVTNDDAQRVVLKSPAESAVDFANHVGEYVTITCDVANFSTSGGLLHIWMGSTSSANYRLGEISGNGQVVFTHKIVSGVTSELQIRQSGSGGFNLSIDNLRIEYVGALAVLPMDEGVGFQLHDLSPNHFDALLSATGFEHLKPKREGFIRDFAVDAYNGGAGNVQLVSSSRDILPDGVVIGKGVFGNVGASSVAANALAVKRSDRSVSKQVGDNGDLIESGYLGPITFSGSQPPAYRNLILDAPTDADATSIDVRIDFEQIN